MIIYGKSVDRGLLSVACRASPHPRKTKADCDKDPDQPLPSIRHEVFPALSPVYFVLYLLSYPFGISRPPVTRLPTDSSASLYREFQARSIPGRANFYTCRRKSKSLGPRCVTYPVVRQRARQADHAFFIKIGLAPSAYHA